MSGYQPHVRNGEYYDCDGQPIRRSHTMDDIATIKARITGAKNSIAEAREHLAAMRQHTATADAILDEVSASLDRIEQRNAQQDEEQ